MRLRALALLAGIAALEAAILLPADSIEAHVVSHALVAVVAAPLLVLAARSASPCAPFARRRRRVVGALRRSPWGRRPRPSRPGRRSSRPTGRPSSWRAPSTTSPGSRTWACTRCCWSPGCCSGCPCSATGRWMPRLRGPAAGLYLFLAMPAADLTAVWLMARGETGAAGVMLAAMAPLGIAAVAVSWSWILREERLARAGEAAR